MKISLRHPQPATGSVLATTLVLGTLLGVTLASYLYWVGTQNVLVAESQAWNRALAVAEAGIEEGMAQINVNVGTLTPLTYNAAIQSPWSPGSGSGPFTRTNATYGYSVTISNDSPPTIYSKGTTVLPLVGRTISRTVRVKTATNGLFGVAIAAILNVDMKGNTITVDAYDSSDTVHFPNGLYNTNYAFAGADISAPNGLVDVQNANIHGRLMLGPNSSYTIGPNGLIGDMPALWPAQLGVESSDWIFYDVNKDFADVMVPYTSGATPGSSTSNQWVLGSGNYYVSGDMTVANNKNMLVTGNACLYVTGNFNAQNNSTIIIQPGATLKLYVGSDSGAAVTANFGLVNNGGNAYNFQLYGLPNCTTFTLTGNNGYMGTLYAPEATFTSSGGGTGSSIDFQGALVAKAVSMNGHFNLHYDKNLARSGPAGSYTLSSWQEL